MTDFFILKTEETDVFKNLAYEASLLEYSNSNNVAILFLWKNDNTIVIGRHQDPFKECDMEFVKEKSIKIARRMTGGGAVYHDKGNLNFSFIASNSIYKRENNFKILINAFKNLGVNAQLSGRNDILFDDKKFSGNAYLKKQNASLHHGTILLTVNKPIISKVLTPNLQKLKSKSVNSVEARITNLIEHFPDLTQAKIEESIIKSFKDFYNIEPKTTLDIEYERYYNLFSSKEWIYKKYQNYNKKLEKYFSWGEFSAKVFIENHTILNLNITSDTLETELIEELETKLKNCNLDNLNKIFLEIKSENKEVLKDLHELFLSLKD